MIRRNIVAVVSTCAALAVGIALGGGPLSDTGSADDTTAQAVSAADQALQERAALGEKWATQSASLVYGGVLSGRRVSIVAMPGASGQVVQQISDAIAVAKGTVSGVVTAAPALTDTTQKVMIDTLGAQYAARSQGTVDPKASTYARLGQLVGVSVAGFPATSSASARATARETLETAKLATVKGGQALCGLVVVVLGDHADPDALSSLMSGIASRAKGIVVTGDTTSGADGDLATLRKAGLGNKVLTVDGDETAYGRAAVVLGIVRQITARGGSFGASGIDGLLPLG